MTKLVLHIGVPKTATTTLQRSVFEQHPDIFYLGKWVPDAPRVWRNEDIHQLFQSMLWGVEKEINQNKLYADYRDLVSEPAKSHRVVVGSNEGLGKLPAEEFLNLLERLRKIPNGVRILALLRNPLTRVPSGYLQQVQGQFIKRRLDNVFKKRPWISLDELLDARSKESGGLNEMVSNVINIRHAIEKLGRENVGVFLFESMQGNPDQFFRDLAGFMDICPEKTVQLARDSHENPRLTQAGYDHAKKVDSSWILRHIWRLQRRSGRTRSLHRAERKTGASKGGAKIELSKAWQERIALQTQEENRWIRDELGLPVEKYGYPL